MHALLPLTEQEEGIREMLESRQIEYQIHTVFPYKKRSIVVNFFLPKSNIVLECWASKSRRGIALTRVERNACYVDLKFKRLKDAMPNIKRAGLVETPQVDLDSVREFVGPIMEHADFMLYSIDELKDLIGQMSGRTLAGVDQIGSLTLLFNKNPLTLPRRVLSHEDFTKSVLAARRILSKVGDDSGTEKFVNRMYYLLGFFVGDLGKHFGPERLLTASVDLSLTKRHPENLQLGEYVMECVRSLGVWSARAPDRECSKNNPHGAYNWQSHRSAVFGWFHEACLGLRWNERTSYARVKMDWILSVPRECRLWFLRGLTDSDGDVHFKDKTVDITTDPNTRLIKALTSSLGLHTTVSFYRSSSRVTINASDAAEIHIFNPEVLTHRRKTLDKLLGAITFERHWPKWLDEKVSGLSDSGLTVVEIRDRLLDEDNVLVKLHTLNRKIERRLHNETDKRSAGGGTPVVESRHQFEPTISGL